jgi:hypothetical protein
MPFNQDAVERNLRYLTLPESYLNSRSKTVQKALTNSRIVEGVMLESGYLNPDWRTAGIKWQDPPNEPSMSSASATPDVPPSSVPAPKPNP